jgi:Ca2+-binding EF-hand superfamily protein
MFDRFSGGKDVIRRSELTDPRAQMMYDRLADRLKISNGEITREQFVGAMRDFRGRGGNGGGPNGPAPAGGSAPGAGGGSAPGGNGNGADRSDEWAEAMFRRLDQNGDGFLNNDEMPEALRAEREKWDTDGNGLIDLTEFKAYFRARVQQFLIDRGGQGGWGGQGPGGDPGQAPPPAAPPEPEVKRPVVHRAGSLPKELPDWFDKLDTDRDGQVGLYEWRAAGRPIAEFLKMDRNGDGFLTVDEVLFYQQQNGGAAAVASAGRPADGGNGGNAGGQVAARPSGGDGPQAMDRGRNGGGRDGGQGGGRNGGRRDRGSGNGRGGDQGRSQGR